MVSTKLLFVIGLAGCGIGPQVSDTPIDSAIPPDVAPSTTILPQGSPVPSIGTNPELLNQIRINDGLSDSALMTNNNVVTRGTGKSGTMTVRYWNFGPAPVEGNFAVAAPLYVLGRIDTLGVFTPLATHLPLIDTVCGDVRYSPIRRVYNVPVTTKYANQLITSTTALGQAIDLGLVEEPVPDGTWVNMPVVLPGTRLEVSDTATVPSKQVYGRGYTVDVFELGTSLGRQPVRGGSAPIGQASGLQSGVAVGGVLSTAVDAQPVFQYTIPTIAPTTTPNYTPLATDVTVRLANGVVPAAITSDASLFKRSSSGSITGYFIDAVASYTVNTTTNNLQLQFVEGSP